MAPQCSSIGRENRTIEEMTVAVHLAGLFCRKEDSGPKNYTKGLLHDGLFTHPYHWKNSICPARKSNFFIESCRQKVWQKSVFKIAFKGCPTKVSWQQCLTRLCSLAQVCSEIQTWLARLSHKRLFKEFLARVSQKSVLTRVPQKSVCMECFTEVPRLSVPQTEEQLQRVVSHSYKSVQAGWNLKQLVMCTWVRGFYEVWPGCDTFIYADRVLEIFASLMT